MLIVLGGRNISLNSPLQKCRFIWRIRAYDEPLLFLHYPSLVVGFVLKRSLAAAHLFVSLLHRVTLN